MRELSVGIRQLIEHLGDPDPGSYVDSQHRALIQQLVRQQVERKLIYQDFLRTVPNDALPSVQQMVDRQFEQSELPKLLEREGAQSRQDLEWKLRAAGSSLDREKRIFMEQAIAEEWIREQVKGPEKDEVTHEQMHTWYQAHLRDFDRPARARWEELIVSFAKHGSNEEAQRGHRGHGKPGVGRGAAGGRGAGPLRGPDRRQGRPARLDQPGEPGLRGSRPGPVRPCRRASSARSSTSKTGYHIIRVVERQPARRIPFLEAQKEVREKIRQEQFRKQYREYLDRSRSSSRSGRSSMPPPASPHRPRRTSAPRTERIPSPSGSGSG